MTTEEVRLPFRKGDAIQIKPEWQDEGDDKFVWIATDDEALGRVTIMPLNTELTYPPWQTVSVDMLVPKRSREHGD